MGRPRITSLEVQKFEIEHTEMVRRMVPECMVLKK